MIRQRYPQINLPELLHHARMEAYEVADQEHWFSQEQVDRFYERLVAATGNENIAREAGRFAASPDALGAVRQYALSLLGPANAFELIQKFTSNFVRSSVYSSRRLRSNKVEITVTPHTGVSEKPFQCANRMGFFEAIVWMFNCNLSEIHHPECMFSGANSCKYVISWQQSPAYIRKTIANIAAVVGLGLSLGTLIYRPGFALSFVIPAATILVLLLKHLQKRAESKDLYQSLAHTRRATDTLLEQMRINYNNALMANEIGQVISGQTDIDSILTNVVQILDNRLDFDRGMVLLADSELKNLTFRAGFGYSTEQQTLLSGSNFRLDRLESRGVFVVCFREQKPFLVNDFNDIEASLSARSLAVAKSLGAKSFICCPIICDGRSLGVLAVDNFRSKRPLVQSDMSLLLGLAPIIGVSLRNAELLQAGELQFRSVIEVLSASTDARDPLTAGHSEKVTEYTLAICEQMNLPHEFREMIRVAALLHDYGKIGVPDSILKKDGRLTDAEYEIVKTHAQKTREILERINFEGIYSGVPEIAGAHHEKLDGSGYPLGLKGEAIPLGAKIIAVADFFEAITTKRHYRAPMPIPIAFQLLREESGVHFDPNIVEALIARFTKNQEYRFEPSEWQETRRIRIPFQTEVSFRVGEQTIGATSADLSESGIYIATERKIGENCPVELSFGLARHRINAKGRVAWVNSSEMIRKRAYPTGFGVEFKDINQAARTMVSEFIANHIRGVGFGAVANLYQL
jgi:HD-GYP domain-containing protein (c-di-GMP phosphodiesterase class II)/Tfp pilus assembly protein PilZ